jgi:flagellar FliL protein
MENPSMEKESEEQNREKTSKNKKKKIFIFGGVLLILLLGIGGILFISPDFIPGRLSLFSKNKSSSEAKKEESRKIGYLYGLDPIIVNLADIEVSRYLKIRIEMEGNSLKPEEEIDKRLPQLKDAIITVLSSKTFKELYDRKGKENLKEEIIHRVNQLLGESKIKKIYFTEFVIQ